MHKTGSTSIQESFSEFDNDNISYFQLGNSNHSAIHSTIFLENPENYHGHKRSGRTKESVQTQRSLLIERVTEELNTKKQKSLITSGEDISIMDEPSLITMRDFFRDHFSKILIIGYVRSPASFMASALQQRLVGGQSVKIKSLYPEYKEKFSKFDHVFGKENVVLKKFQKNFLDEGNVVIDFANLIGAKIDKSKIVFSNEGRGLEVASLLFAHRKLSGSEFSSSRGRSVKGDVIHLLRSLNSESLKLHRDAVLPILEEKREDIDWMEDRLGVSLEENLSTHDSALRELDDFFQVSCDILPDLGVLVSDEIKRSDGGLGPKLQIKYLSLLQHALIGNRELMAKVLKLSLSEGHTDPKVAAIAMDLLFDIFESRAAKLRNRGDQKNRVNL